MPREAGPREKAARALREARFAEGQARTKAAQPPKAEKIAKLAAAIAPDKIPARKPRKAKAKKAKRAKAKRRPPIEVPF